MCDTDPTGTPESDVTPTDPTAAFQARLGELILSAFGRGAIVETTLEVEGPAADAPNWRVTIEKVPPEARTYEPTVLEDDVEL